MSSVTFDVKRNSENLTILYFNARSILPKIDNLAAVCFALNPDIVCIVESWLGESIADKEVSLPGYSITRLDRNRHGGGILIYIKCNLSFRVVLSGPSDLELIFVSVQLSCISLCCLEHFIGNHHLMLLFLTACLMLFVH